MLVDSVVRVTEVEWDGLIYYKPSVNIEHSANFNIVVG
jgi:hypothetical protein